MAIEGLRVSGKSRTNKITIKQMRKSFHNSIEGEMVHHLFGRQAPEVVEHIRLIIMTLAFPTLSPMWWRLSRKNEEAVDIVTIHTPDFQEVYLRFIDIYWTQKYITHSTYMCVCVCYCVIY